MIGRSQGRSAVACAAYRSGQTLADDRYGKVHDYAPRRVITQAGIVAPENAPGWAYDREKLWNHVEAVESRKDAQLAREFTLALPSQVSDEVRVELVETFIREQLIPRGMIVDYAIHAPNRKGDERNFHAHLMTTLRPLEAGELSLIKDREACTREFIETWREAWAAIQNRAFERLQIKDEEGRILHTDHRSYEAQNIDREPTMHVGVLAMALERQGVPTEIGDRNRAIRRANDMRQNFVRPGQQLSHEGPELDRPDPARPERYRPNRNRRDRDRDDYER